MKKYLYVYAPGLGGEDILQRQRDIVASWSNDFRSTLFLESEWMNRQESYEEKIQRLQSQVLDEDVKSYDAVCIVGTSAGGTLGLNLFYELSEHVKNLFFVSISGKIIGSDAIGPSFSEPHPALIPSVLESENNISQLTTAQKQHILSVKPLFDEVVFTKFMNIQGANHKIIWVIGHIFSIYHGIKHPSKYIFSFVEKKTES